MERGDFEHRAVVEQIMSHAVRVSIVQETACATCVAAQLCNSSEKKQKTMDIVCDTSQYRVGQEVTIVGSLGLGLKATLLAYVVPLFIMMTVLIGVNFMTGSESVAAVACLFTLTIYCGGLYLFRDKLQRTFQFRIVKN